ncbi:MAG: hypothetical protein HDS07_09650 [Bacteroides sp.]|nr:hypothetical protein [Bacteroides sp.]
MISKSALRITLHQDKYSNEDYHYYTAHELFNVDVNNLSEYNKLRLVVDFVSGMTDKFAVTLYQELIGIKI